MKFDKFGYWVINSIAKTIPEEQEDNSDGTPDELPGDPLDEEPLSYIDPDRIQEPKKLIGKCILMIRFNNKGEHLKWKKYFGAGRQWEFIVSYPAIMQAEYSFRNSLEAETMAKRVVQLLEMGFDVHSSQWRLEKEENKNE